MTVRLSSDRKEIFNAVSFKLLDWLAALPEYRRLYRGWRKQIEEGKVLEYPIKRIKRANGTVVYKVVIRPEDLTTGEPQLVSPSQIKGKQRKFEKQVTASMYLRQQIWKKKIGFYPSLGPNTDENFLRGCRYSKRRFSKAFFWPAIQVLNFSMDVIENRQRICQLAEKNPRKFRLRALPPLPSKLKIEVNYRESIELIQDELGWILESIKKEYGIPQRRWQVEPELEFKASLLKRMDLTREMIRERLTLKTGTFEQKESHRKKLQRVLDKVFKTPA